MRAMIVATLALAVLSGCATNADVADLQTRVAQLESDNSDLQTRVAQLESDNADLQAALADTVTTSDLSGYVSAIAAPTTLNVPGDYATLADALAYLDGYRITGKGVVTIKIADGTYDFADPIVFDHPDGARIRVRGDLADVGAVTLHYTGSGTAVEVAPGMAVGGFGDLTLTGSGTGTGILAIDGARFVAGLGAWNDVGDTFIGLPVDAIAGHLVVSNFRTAFDAEDGATLIASGTQATHDTTGYQAFFGGTLVARSSTCDNGTGGYVSAFGSTVAAGGSSATNEGVGLTANAAYLDATGAEVTSATYGAEASANGMILAPFAHFHTTTADLSATEDGYIDVHGAASWDGGDYTLEPTASPTATSDASVGAVVYWQ